MNYKLLAGLSTEMAEMDTFICCYLLLTMRPGVI